MIRSHAVICFLAFFNVITPTYALAGQYQVIRVVDGDTIFIKYDGKYVDLEFEIKRLRGNNGHLPAYVFVDGQNLNLDLVRQGLSPYHTKYGKSEKYNAEFRSAEKQVRKENLNIWG